MRLYVDATTLISLGTVGELTLLENFDGRLAVPDEVREEVTTEPARTNLEQFCSRESVSTGEDVVPGHQYIFDAQTMLDEEEVTGDVVLIGAVLMYQSLRDQGADVGVVSDDARVRTVADGLGATVTGTVGVVVRAVHEGMAPGAAKDLVRRLDDHGLHMTGELREMADRLIEEVADDRG